MQLEQSPFLNVLSEEKVSQELGYMARPRDARLTRDVAQEVCQRTGSRPCWRVQLPVWAAIMCWA